jgi:hypothetical protein
MKCTWTKTGKGKGFHKCRYGFIEWNPLGRGGRGQWVAWGPQVEGRAFNDLRKAKKYVCEAGA